MKNLSVAAGLSILLAGLSAAQDITPASSPSLLEAPLIGARVCFIENRGVCADEVAYYVRGADKTLFFTKHGVTFRLTSGNRAWALKLEFVGANPEVNPEGENRQPAVFSYFTGPKEEWKTGLRTYGRVVYHDLWPGIDLAYRGDASRLKYEFVVKPGADPERIRLRYRGATALEITRSRGLRVDTPFGSFVDEAPLAHQDVGSRSAAVEVEYLLLEASDSGREFGFRIGPHDRTRPLIVDPAVVVQCGYIGGASGDWALDVAVDAAGNAYVTGFTDSDEKSFPVTVGPHLGHGGGYSDAYVAKISSDGKRLIYCGYIGGIGNDRGTGIAVDAAGNAYVAGLTTSSETTFPVKIGPDLTYNGDGGSGGGDAFVAKVNAGGTALEYCGYIGGSGADAANDIVLDGNANVWVTGHTSSDQNTFPAIVGPDLTHNGGTDAFVARVKPDGTGLASCGYIGGAGEDCGFGIAADAAGNPCVAGRTTSDETGFPVKAGPDLTFNGVALADLDAFVAKVAADGTALVYCGYIGGARWDEAFDVACTPDGSAFVAGTTQSDETTFPVTVGPRLVHQGGLASWPSDAFVAKVGIAGTTLEYCGYIGGKGTDDGVGVAVDVSGSAFVAGTTASDQTTFPVGGGPGSTFNGARDTFVAKLDPKGITFVYLGYLGGSDVDDAYGIALDPRGSVCVVGSTGSDSNTFPVRIGPSLTYSGRHDGYLARIALTLLEASGTTRPGGRVYFRITATDDASLPYQVGSSFGNGPIRVGAREIGLSPDGLLMLSVSGSVPQVFTGYRGTILANGQSAAVLHLPPVPGTVGLRIHTAFVTLSPSPPSGIKSVSNTFAFTITAN